MPRFGQPWFNVEALRSAVDVKLKIAHSKPCILDLLIFRPNYEGIISIEH